MQQRQHGHGLVTCPCLSCHSETSSSLHQCQHSAGAVALVAASAVVGKRVLLILALNCTDLVCLHWLLPFSGEVTLVP